MIRIRVIPGIRQCITISLLAALVTACSDPTGGDEPNTFTDLEGTWVGTTAEQSLTMHLRPTTLEIKCVLVPGMCQVHDTEYTATYTDRRTGAVVETMYGRVPRDNGRSVIFDLGSQSLSETEWRDLTYRGTLTSATRIEGDLVMEDRKANTPSDPSRAIAVALTLERR